MRREALQKLMEQLEQGRSDIELDLAVAHPGGEIGHAIQHRVHVWDDIFAVDHDGSIPGCP